MKVNFVVVEETCHFILFFPLSSVSAFIRDVVGKGDAWDDSSEIGTVRNTLLRRLEGATIFLQTSGVKWSSTFSQIVFDGTIGVLCLLPHVLTTAQAVQQCLGL